MYIDLGGHNYGPITLTVTTSGYHKDPGWDIKVCIQNSNTSHLICILNEITLNSFNFFRQITQVRCCDRAPDGCLQYHYGVSGMHANLSINHIISILTFICHITSFLFLFFCAQVFLSHLTLMAGINIWLISGIPFVSVWKQVKKAAAIK